MSLKEVLADRAVGESDILWAREKQNDLRLPTRTVTVPPLK